MVNNTRYALLEERAAPAPAMTRDEALVELTRRFLTGHGPATTRDFGWWSSLSAADIKRGLNVLEAHLQRETIDGVTFWFDPSIAAPNRPSPSVYLQGYDEYFVAYSGKSKGLMSRELRGPSQLVRRASGPTRS